MNSFQILIIFCTAPDGVDCKLMAVERKFPTEFECITSMNDYFNAGGPDAKARELNRPYVSGVCLSDDDVKEFNLVIGG